MWVGESMASGERDGQPGALGQCWEASAWWRWYLLSGLVAMATVPMLPNVGRQVVYGVVGCSAVVALLIGVRWHRPAAPRPWRLFTAGAVASLGGVVWWAFELALTGVRVFPSAGDLMYFCTYPFLIAGLATWVRRDRNRPGYESVVDAGLVVCGLSALSWTFIGVPMVAHATSVGQRLPGYLLYTAMDLIIIAMAVRLSFSAAVRTTAYLLTVAGGFALLTADSLYYILTAWGAERVGNSLAAPLWILTYLLMGTAALHPSMAWSTGVVERSQPVASPLRLALYALLAVLAPAVAVGIVVMRGPDSPAGALVMPLLLAAATAVLLVVRLGLLARVAHRRASELDAHTVALGAALEEQQALRDELTYRALHDSLTGLGNRALLGERLDALTGRHGLVLLDLDGFKDVNDTYGHPAGDELLVDVALRLRTAVTDGVMVRLGGDEFALLLEDVGPTRTWTAAEAMVNALREPFVAGDRETALTASAGTFVADAPLAMGEALRRADLALYAAKDAGKNRVYAYTPQLAADRDRQMTLITDLRRALVREEFVVHYQPVVELATGRVTAVEALVRWTPPGRPPVPPGEFIPVAEECGLIAALGAWVLRRALRDVRAWYERYGVSVTVNFSVRQLRESGIADLILGELAANRLPGAALVVEITETVLVAEAGPEGAAVRALLDGLREHGVRIAVDDFGTGYSSLAYLRTLPVDILKIDRAFVQEPAGGSDPVAFLRAIIQMARSLRLSTVAEAVETSAQATRLRQLHCPLVQGYYFSRPIPAEDLDALLSSTGGRIEVEATVAA
jgi:diguanylate cyclase (GGDEF)-like protein